jgi:hypothetical protein
VEIEIDAGRHSSGQVVFNYIPALITYAAFNPPKRCEPILHRKYLMAWIAREVEMEHQTSCVDVGTISKTKRSDPVVPEFLLVISVDFQAVF